MKHSEEENLVIKVLVEEINKSPRKAIYCARIKKYLKDADIPDTVFSGMKLRPWLTKFYGKDFFMSEVVDLLFYIGREYPKARTITVVPEIFKDYLRNKKVQQASVTEINQYMQSNFDFDLTEFCGEADPAKWLEQNFPELSVAGEFVCLKGEAPSPVLVTTPELEMFSALVSTDNLNKKAKEICKKLGITLSAPDIKSKLASDFANIFVQDICWIDRFDGKQILAFPVSLTKDHSKSIYCILTENNSTTDTTQYWSVFDFILYPDATNTDATYRWLEQKIENISGNGITIASLRKNADEITALRQDILSEMEQLTTALRNGTRPNSAFGETLLEYEKLWASFAQNLSVYFNESFDTDLSLEDISLKLSESNTPHAFYEEIIKSFLEYLQTVDTILQTHLHMESPTVAEQDMLHICNKNEDQAEQVELSFLKEKIAIYRKFQDMITEKNPQKQLELFLQLRGDFDFSENQNPYQILMLISMISKEELLPLESIAQVESYLERYIKESGSNASKKRQRKEITANELLNLRIENLQELMRQWVEITLSVLPENFTLTTSMQSNTPYGVGSSLYQQCNNEAQMAEKYFILGSVFDQANCIPALLRIYREQQDFDKFLLIWDQFDGQASATDDDVIFLMKALLNENQSEKAVLMFANILKNNPSLRLHPSFSELLSNFITATTEISEAFRMWCENTSVTPNAFETAIANNYPGEIFSLLDTPDSLTALGYTEEEIESIKMKLRADFPGGISDYAKGMRIYLVQENKNRTAEKFFWLAASESQNQAALLRLFDIYIKNEDYQSVNWLVKFMKVSVEQSLSYRLSYARSLIACKENNTLITFAKNNPDILSDVNICAYVTDIASETEPGYDWKLIAEQKVTPQTACPFEEALFEGNRERMGQYLEDSSSMAAWGYPSELQSHIQEYLQTEESFGSEEAAICSRIWAVQENLHGFYENYLYQFIDSNRSWFLSRLIPMLFLSKRYEELILFADAEEYCRRDDQIMLSYLWSLIHTNRLEALMNIAKNHVPVIAKAPELQLKLEEIYQNSGRMQDFEDLLTKMHVISRNAFESCLIDYDEVALHSFVSDRERLQSLGYSEEQIDWFSSCYTKPFDKSDDPFAVACRIRTFLGDSRSLQFFCDIEATDPRAAKMLFDIYYKNKRYDDLCFLYRRHDEEIWNDHFFALYTKALCKANAPENCKALVTMIDGWSSEQRNETETLWNHLTALIGSGQSLTRIEIDEELLLEKEDALKMELLKRCFDIAWTKETEFRENIVAFAAKMLNVFAEKISFDAQKCIASINGNLLNTEEDTHWIDFIEKLASPRMLFVLHSVYGYGFSNHQEKLNFIKNLSEKLQDAEPEDITVDSMYEYFSVLNTCSPRAEESHNIYNEYIMRLFMFTVDKCQTPLSEAEQLRLCSLLSKAELSCVQQNPLISLMDLVSAYCNSAESLHKNDPIIILGINLIREASKRMEDAVDEEKTAWLHTAEYLSSHLCKRIEANIREYSCLQNDANWTHFSGYFKNELFSQEMAVSIADAILSGLQQSNAWAENFKLLNVLPEKIHLAIQPEQLKNVLISFIRNKINDTPEDDEIKAIESALFCCIFSKDDIKMILDALIEKKLLSHPLIFSAIRNYCHSIDHKTEYELYKMLLKESSDESDYAQILKFSAEILDCARDLPEGALSSHEDLELIYRSVCKQNSDENLAFLQKLYENAGFSEQKEILSILLHLSNPETSALGIAAVKEMFDQRPMEWIELYAKWWEPLVSLSENEAQAQTRVPYLTEDIELEADMMAALMKLLMSNIHEPTYLKACSNTSLNFTDAAKNKLHYLVALSGESAYQLVSAIKKLLAEKEAELAVALLRKLMNFSVSNSSVMGQLLGEIYTQTNVQMYDILTKITPEIYEWILKMNSEDPQGIWKNYGRAVEIAGLTHTEMVLFDIVGSDFFLNQPGYCAVVIAELIKQGRYDEAARWHEEAYKKNNHQYLAIEAGVLENCLVTSQLSYTDQLLLQSISPVGNNRTLENYGELVFTACNDGKEAECLWVLKQLYPYENSDWALLLPLMNLLVSQDIKEEQLTEFYEYSLQLLQTSASVGNQAEKKAAYIFTAADVCCPKTYEKEVKWLDALQLNCSLSPENFNELMIEIKRFKDDCEMFLMEGGTCKLLLSCVMGRWNIDSSFLKLFSGKTDFEKVLINLHKASFIAACISAAIQNNIESDDLLEQLTLSGNPTMSLICDMCEQISAVASVRDELLLRLRNPLDIPGVISHVFESIMQTEEEYLEQVLTLFFSAISYTYEKYRANVYDVKEYVDNHFASAKTKVVSVLIQLYYLRTGKPPLPAVCASQRDYMLMINAAEYHCKHPNENVPEVQQQRYHYLNQDYALLGKIMEGQLNAKELSKIPLAKLVNLTILLCQNENAYVDLHVILSICPAKWKICLRCVQELIQGCPSNILYVMEKDSFWTEHEGCAAYVARLATRFLWVKKKLNEENRQKRRANNWGYFKETDIREVNEKIARSCEAIPFWTLSRNPKDISDFHADIDAYIIEMENEDFQKKQRSAALKTAAEASAKPAEAESGTEEENDYVQLLNYRNLNYINKALSSWKEQKETGAEPTDSTTEEINHLCEQIHDKLDDINNADVRLNCIMLGFLLFQQNCDGDHKDHVTEEALDILEEISKCISDSIKYRLPFNHISVAVYNTLYTAKNWESLLACCKPWLLFLSEQIDDPNKRQSYSAHIKFIQEIGSKLSKIMTTTEQYEYIEGCIKACRAKQSTLDRGLKQTLINFLNHELLAISNQAHLTLDIYEKSYSFMGDTVTGMVRNLGKQPVTDVVLELRIDDVCISRCTLEKLEPEAMVPFSVPFYCDEEAESVDCQVYIQYVTSEGNTENFKRESKLLSKTDEEAEYTYEIYATGRPAENDNYVEREKLQKKLKVLYSPEKPQSELPSLVVYGMRRMGKSSLLRWLKKHVEENFGDKLLVSFIDLESVAKNISSLTARVQYCLVEKTLASIGTAFAGEEWNNFRDHWLKPIPPGDNFDWILDFYSNLKNSFLGERQLFLILDEIEGLYMNNRKNIAGRTAMEPDMLSENIPLSNQSDSDGPVDVTAQTNFWDTLSVVTQDSAYGITLVLCGADPFTNTVMAGDNLTQFFQRTEKLSIGRMTPAEIRTALLKIEEISDIVYHRDTIDYLWTITAGLPWHSKRIMNTAIGLLQEEETRAMLYPYDVLYGTNEIFSSDQDISDNSMGMNATGADEKIFLDLLAEKTTCASTWVPKSVLWEGFREKVVDEDASARFNKVLKLLIEGRQMILKRNSDSGEEYRFGSELNRLFVRKQRFIPQFISK